MISVVEKRLSNLVNLRSHCNTGGKMSEVKRIVKQYMVVRGLDNGFKDLAKKSGIKYQTLLDHMDAPELLRVSEIRSINDVLQFSSEDLLKIIE